jgi:serine/threonine-protein kinase
MARMPRTSDRNPVVKRVVPPPGAAHAGDSRRVRQPTGSMAAPRQRMAPATGSVAVQKPAEVVRLDGATAPGSWTAGTRFSRYEIGARLAVGGMAEVWRGKVCGPGGFEKSIVFKTMLAHLQRRPELVELFAREAALGARLGHPNVIQTFDFGEHDGRNFIVMEHVPGPTLRQAQKRLMARGERVPMTAVLSVMADVCEALHYLHELNDGAGPLGLVHRDLSCDNVMISDAGLAKLIDFGTARSTTRMLESRTFVGKYRYAAPERIRDLREDHRSDVYSVGVILYECLTGVRPFEGPDADVICAIVTSLGRDPSEHAPELPAAVARTVSRAMNPDPAQRHATARELGEELRAALPPSRSGGSFDPAGCMRALVAAVHAVPARPPTGPVPAIIVEDEDCEIEVLG